MAMVVCPICATRYRVGESQLSKASRLKCKKCKTVFPVSDNIRAEDALPEEEGFQQPDTSAFQDQTLSYEKSEDTGQSSGTGFGFEESADSSSAPTLDFSLSENIPGQETGTDSDTGSSRVEIQDHIVDTSQENQGQIEVGLGNLSLEGKDEGETTLSMDLGLDFSFSAVIPEASPEDEASPDGEASEWQEEEPGGGGEGGAGDLDLSLDGLRFGEAPEDATMTMSDSPSAGMTPPLSEISHDLPVGGGIEAPVEGYGQEEEPLATCCIDSLTMGLTTCEICGRNLEGRAHDEVVQERRQQLREELPQGEAQIAFSEEKVLEEAPPEDDFSDVERALDALADGSFEKEIKKREAKKYRRQRYMMFGGVVVLAVALLAAVAVTLLPSTQERLEAKYQDLLKQPEMDPADVVALFLDAVEKQEKTVFEKLSVIPTMPTNIAGGNVVTVGEELEETSLGVLGQEVSALQEELAQLNERYQTTEKKWQEESALDLSPGLIEVSIKQLTKKQEDLQQEYAAKEAESAKKMRGFEQDLEEANQELEENRRRADQYIDDTTPQGKAMYTASIRNQQSLSDKIAKLQDWLAEERTKYAQRMQKIDAEYTPRFTEVANGLAEKKALYEKAILLKDRTNSPLILLDKELKTMKAELDQKEQLLQEQQQELQKAVAFFKRREQHQQVEQNQNIAEFTHSSRNVVASIKFKGESKQKVPVVLKRYRAIIGDQRIQGDWIVEAVLR